MSCRTTPFGENPWNFFRFPPQKRTCSFVCLIGTIESCCAIRAVVPLHFSFFPRTPFYFHPLFQRLVIEPPDVWFFLMLLFPGSFLPSKMSSGQNPHLEQVIRSTKVRLPHKVGFVLFRFPPLLFTLCNNFLLRIFLVATCTYIPTTFALFLISCRGDLASLAPTTSRKLWHRPFRSGLRPFSTQPPQPVGFPKSNTTPVTVMKRLGSTGLDLFFFPHLFPCFFRSTLT